MTDIKEARGLEVVASLHQHFDGRRRVQVPNGVYDQDAGWGAKVEPLCRLSDATAVIDQLLAELAALKDGYAKELNALCERNYRLRMENSDLKAMLAAAPAQPKNDAVIELLSQVADPHKWAISMCDTAADLLTLLGGDQPAQTGSAKGGEE